MPVALISTSTSPNFGPWRSTVSMVRGWPACQATAALVFMGFGSSESGGGQGYSGAPSGGASGEDTRHAHKTRQVTEIPDPAAQRRKLVERDAAFARQRHVRKAGEVGNGRLDRTGEPTQAGGGMLLGE